MDNFGGIFTTLSQTCKKFHCLKNGQRVDSWENDCLRQKDADSVGCLFNPSFVRGRCPRTARLEEVFWGILMTAKHSGSAGGPPPDFFDDPVSLHRFMRKLTAGQEEQIALRVHRVRLGTADPKPAKLLCRIFPRCSLKACVCLCEAESAVQRDAARELE